MMFHDISHRIAAQFTAFVFVLLLVTGAIFFVADMADRGRQGQDRLLRQLRPVLEHQQVFGTIPPLPPFQRERLRIADSDGKVLFSGTFFEGLPFTPGEGLSVVVNSGEEYGILTVPFSREGTIVGYLQIVDRQPPEMLLRRVVIFLIVSVGISGLTYLVGLFFARRSLRPAERMMQRLEQFTQDASHELRTPLTAVSTSLDLALLSPDNHAEIRAAKDGLKEMSLLVERLLELARLDSFAFHPEFVQLDAIVRDVVEKQRPLVEAKGLLLTLRDEPVTVRGDAALLRQVAMNLIGNAVKFTNQGTVAVELSERAFVVRDTGRGISAQALPHVFDRFYQEDASRDRTQKGLGLGLALAKRIVDLHGWSIDVESEEGKGTVFTVSLSQ